MCVYVCVCLCVLCVVCVCVFICVLSVYSPYVPSHFPCPLLALLVLIALVIIDMINYCSLNVNIAGSSSLASLQHSLFIGFLNSPFLTYKCLSLLFHSCLLHSMVWLLPSPPPHLLYQRAPSISKAQLLWANQR